jgi:hypothetical protein
MSVMPRCRGSAGCVKAMRFAPKQNGGNVDA